MTHGTHLSINWIRTVTERSRKILSIAFSQMDIYLSVHTHINGKGVIVSF